MLVVIAARRVARVRGLALKRLLGRIGGMVRFAFGHRLGQFDGSVLSWFRGTAAAGEEDDSRDEGEWSERRHASL